ncbi:MAG TPA: hypothetical protein DEP72_01180 [Clostridiales bacterium]|nr:MAG: hypothetical protein A2Y18_01785 [Clostridiales bacterium GWD2_32_19]HCC06766.1 hypothetical protein [Clostridiales bacterium]
MLKKLMISVNVLFLLASTTLLARAESVIVTTESSEEVGDFISNLISKIMPLAYQIGAFLIFLAVVVAGFDMIKHRKDADKRKEVLHSFLWLAVGAFIIGSAVVIAGMIWNGTVKMS